MIQTHRVQRATVLRIVLLGLSLLILLPLVVSNSACTLVGVAIGVAGSADAPPKRLPAGSVLKVSPGAPIIVATKEQKEFSGVYLGRRLVEDSSYTSRYAAWAATSRRAPSLGGGVEIELEDGSQVRGAFDGFTYRAVRVVADRKLGPESFAFKRVRWMQADRLERWTGDELARLDMVGEIPTREAIRVGIVRPFSWNAQGSSMTSLGSEATHYAEQVVLPVDRVAAILVRGRSSAPLVLGLMGLVLDVIVVRSLDDQLSHPKCGESSGQVQTLTYIERSEYDFLPAAGEYAPAALVTAGRDSASALRDP